MARFEVTAPNGSKYEITAPDDASDDDIAAYAKAQFADKEPPVTPAIPATPAVAPENERSFADSALLGLKKRGSGLVELGLNAAQNFGYDVADEKAALADVQNQYDKQGTGTGVKGFVGEILGDPLSYIPGIGATKGVSTLAKAGLGAGLLSGVTTGTGDEKSTLRDNAYNAGEQGVLGALIGGALGKIGSTGKSIANGIGARGIDELTAVGDEIKAASSAAYKQMRAVGAVVKPSSARTIFTDVNTAVSGAGKLNNKLHGDTISVLGDLKKATQGRKGLGLEEIDQFRQQLSDVVQRNTDVRGKINGDALKAKNAIKVLDDAVDRLGASDLTNGTTDAMDALNLGRSEWARYSKHSRVADILKKADGDPNRIKSLIKQFVNNDKNLRGFTKQEVAALRIASRQTVGEGALKTLGKFGFDFGNSTTFGNTALPAGAIALGNPALAVAGTVARQGQKYLARSAAENAMKAIEGAVPQADNALLKAVSGAGVGAAISGISGAGASAAEQAPSQFSEPSAAPSPISPQSSLPADIRQDEGLRFTTYTDTTGNPTIGYGFNLNSGIAKKVWKKAGIPTPFEQVAAGTASITPQEAEALGRESYNIAYADAADIYSDLDKLNEPRKEALLNLSYQFGKPRLSALKEFNAAVNKKDWKRAARELGKTKYYKQTPARAQAVIRKLLQENV